MKEELNRESIEALVAYRFQRAKDTLSVIMTTLFIPVQKK